jgi:cytochrome c oxidase subunit 1
LKYGEIAGNNPWRAAGLEWTTQSPPITENFTEIQDVTEEAYNYAKIDNPVTVGNESIAAS